MNLRYNKKNYKSNLVEFKIYEYIYFFKFIIWLIFVPLGKRGARRQNKILCPLGGQKTK